jgi:hypothetical protein
MDLSYRWGGPRHVTLTSTSMVAFSKEGGLNFSTLTLGLQHALELTMILGYQHLWIDALCILQDSIDDQFHKVSTLKDYYTNAMLVTQPSGMRSVAEGFLGSARNPQGRDDHFLKNIGIFCPNHFEIPILGRDKQSVVHTLNSTWYSPSHEFINSRAWVLQERLLCPRVLILSSVGGPIFQCEKADTYQGKIHYGFHQLWENWSLSTKTNP